MERARRVALSFAFAFMAPAGLAAQGSARSTVVRVHVVDSSGVPVAGADVTVRRGLTDILGHAQTDPRGDRMFTIATVGSEDEIIVRKIGFTRTSRFFRDDGAEVRVEVRIARAAHTLDTVKVAEREDPVRKSYFIDAEQIENSPRYLADALDIVMKLRPDMVWGRQGRPDGIGTHETVTITRRGQVNRNTAPPVNATKLVANGAKYGYCGPVRSISVNGSWIRGVLQNATAILRTNANVPINSQVASVLGSIKPEYVQEIQYYPCTTTTDSSAHLANSIAVQLKPGIVFDETGSHPVGSSMDYLVSREALAAGREPVAIGVNNRILGVFDAVTGDPIDSVAIVDVSTGTKALTTRTGTAGLGFLAAGDQQIRIEKAGFVAQTLTVKMSPSDTSAITIVLARSSDTSHP